jgi:hypothetical protein
MRFADRLSEPGRPGESGASGQDPPPSDGGKRILDCPCGERIVGTREDQLVEKAERHLAMSHPGRRYSRDEILFLAF